jgi:DnaJ-class molecular chaperone
MNPYNILGVSNESDSNEIKKAYRKLSLQYHPDRNSQEEAKTKILEINAAYEMIGNPESKRQYDSQMNHPFFGRGGGGGFHHGGNDEFTDIGSIFNMMFNNHGGGGPGIQIFHNGVNFAQQIQKPTPIMHNISLSIEQCYTGCTLPIEIEKWTIENDMKRIEKENIYLTIPPGIDSNEFIILRNKGNEINDNCIGDIKIGINIQNQTEFIRNGLDLIYKKKTSLKDALCGFSFELKHISGQNLCLNNKSKSAVIKPNFKKVIPNLGMIRDNITGNLIIEFDIEFPDVLSPEQINALEKIL